MIANQFEGDITVDSKLGKGSIFTFTMALYEDISQEEKISIIRKNRKNSSIR